ncbi:DUF4435 domain-containing protein [Acinetobacter pittii]|uniref:DUF4435 domain-containing protein n=1 Tax=Acinetobacter pittii TaxID=48296 RepID=UPI0021D23AE5|nr:DUF4435 domain-containing protein [Acinetobacter pittii]MCU4525183.1 DUF4435 domain-containing protein [Acinetobacter pittii]
MSHNIVLKKIAEEQLTFLDEAYGMYRSQTYSKFIFVEGLWDKKFLKKKGFSENEYYYLGMCGKDMVLSSLQAFKNSLPYSKISKIAFVIDNDYDHIINNIVFDEKLFINSVCNTSKQHYLNDLESYLVCSHALEDWLDEFGLTSQEIKKLKKEVECESRRIGKYRAANELLKKEKNLPVTSTILFKFDIEEFFDCKNFLFLAKDFEARVRLCSPYKHLVDELFTRSEEINHTNNKEWQLSRGHDITELISLYLYINFSISLSAKEIEQYLRLSIDTTELDTYHTYKDLKKFFIA